MPINTSDRVWEIMGGFSTALLITNGGLETRGRPMAVTVRREDNALYFLSDVTSDKDYEIQFDPAVIVAFIDPSSHRYVWLRGRAVVANDRAKIRSLWSPFAKAWWENADDPDIRVIEVTPEAAEYWDTAGKLASYAAMLTAAVTGAKVKVGEEHSAGF